MELVILIGLQASGKSTFYREHFAASFGCISMDLLRNNRNPKRRQLQLLEEALREGRSVVIDNTNATIEARAPLIEMGRRYGAMVSGYYFAPNVGQSLVRNRQRQGMERVPDVAVFATVKKLIAPALAEGFDRLFDVALRENGGFEIN